MKKYDWNAGDYAKHSSIQQEWARELFAKLNLQGSETILDLGCGDGKVTAELAAAVPRGSVLGVDNSSVMLELAQETYPTDRLPNLDFELADARNLPFRDQFEVVFSNATLHWVRDHDPVLQGIFQSLVPGGRILLQMGGRGNAAGMIAILQRMIKTTRWAGFFENFDFPYGFHGAEEYERWLKAAGFQDIEVRLIPKDMLHAGKAGLAGWIRTTWLPYTQRPPESKQGLFIDELADNYIQKFPPDHEGNINVKMVRLEVEAVKPD